MKLFSGILPVILCFLSIPAVIAQSLTFIPGEVSQTIQPGQVLIRTVSLISETPNLEYSIVKEDGVDWFEVLNPSGETSPFSSQITLQFDATGLEEGTYVSSIKAISGYQTPATLKITFIVAPSAPKILYIYGEVDRFGRAPGHPSYLGKPFQQMRLDDKSPEGMFKFKQTIEDLGFQVEEALDRTTTLTDELLSDYEIIILASNQKEWNSAEADALAKWVRKGGGVLAFNDANFGGDWQAVGQNNERGRDSNNLLTTQFGLFFFTDQGARSGSNLVTEWATNHFINTKTNKSSALRFRGTGCSPIRVLKDWPEKRPGDIAYQVAPFQNGGQGGTILISDPDLGKNIQNYETDCAIAAAEIGKGRVIGTFDRNTFWNKGVGTNITQYDNFEFTQNLINWLSGKSAVKNDVEVTGELKLWHKITLTFEGPDTHEKDSINPFLDYRLNVVFSNDKKTFIVPGYYAADGNAGETSDSTGNKWRVHFTPDDVGEWTYVVSFRTGKDIAIDPDENAGIANFFDGARGSFNVEGTDKIGRDFRGKGFLKYVGEHHLRFQNGDWFLKAGADSPETLLAYVDFDNTYYTRLRFDSANYIKTWSAHVQDWVEGDPTWQGDKGKGLIGAINYLSGKGNNAMSFIPYNGGGDGTNVWPFVDPDDPLRYDCSKLDQWEVIFEHADKKGMFLHFKTQETENDNDAVWALDRGDLGIERKLYYRELIARFGHHLALNWNMGEENSQTRAQQIDMIQYMHDNDPYEHPIVLHTYPNQTDLYNGLIGDQSELTGPSLQRPFARVHESTLQWINRSAEEGKKWVVCNDEQNPFQTGAPPDTGFEGFDGSATPTQDIVRKQVLWGNLMAGGAGVEYYFGYNLPQNDLNCENWHSRDQMWDYNRYALEFFQSNFIPFWKMTNRNDLIENDDDDNSKYCLAIPDSIYVIYLPNGGTTDLHLNSESEITYELFWYNPRTGGALIQSDPQLIMSDDDATIGPPPTDVDEDWVALVLNPGVTLSVAEGPQLSLRDEQNWFNVFPNPSSDYVQVAYEGPETQNMQNVKAVLYDQDGKLLDTKAFSRESDNWLTGFDLSPYAPGTYYVVINFGGIRVRKIVIADF